MNENDETQQDQGLAQDAGAAEAPSAAAEAPAAEREDCPLDPAPAATAQTAAPVPTVRAKFQMQGKHQSLFGKAITYHFAPVCADEVEENRRFHRYTPSGKLEITVDNPAVSFEMGKSYYLDFTPAD